MADCSDLLKHGIFDYKDMVSVSSLRSKIYEWLKTASFEEVNKKKAAGLKLGFPIVIEGIPTPFEFDFDGDYSEDKFKEFQTYLNQGKIKELENDDYIRLISNTINETAINAWLQCMKINRAKPSTGNVPNPNDIPDSTDGHHVDEYEPGIKYSISELDEDTIIFGTWYIPFGENDSYPKVNSFIVIGATYGKGLSPNEVIDYPKHVILKRDGHKAIKIILTTDKGIVDYVIPESKPPQMIMKFFVSQDRFITGDVKSFTVPEQFKIIGAGWYVRGSMLGELFVYPKSVREWIFEFPKKSMGISDVWTYLITIYDPEDKWDVKIFENMVSNEKYVETKITEDYVLTGGGVNLIQYTEDDSSIEESLNNYWFTAGLTSFYPKDSKTWAVELNDECDSYKFLTWDLKAYAIGIKAKNNEKILQSISSGESNSNAISDDFRVLYLKDKSYTLTGAGIKIDVTPSELLDKEKWARIESIYPLVVNSIDSENKYKGWVFFSKFNPKNNNRIKKYVIGIKHPDLEILHLPPSIKSYIEPIT